VNKFSLSLDDYSSRSGTNDLTWCDKLIEKFPEVKIDLFVPAAYARINDKNPCYLSKHLDWTEQVKKLPKNYRINLHGFFHRRTKRDWAEHRGIESNNNEWENLTYKQADELLNKIEEEFNKVGLAHTKIFRPPGWHVGGEAVRLLKDRGYVIAGNDKYYNLYKAIPSLKWISYNWDLIGPCPTSGDIFCYGHVSDWNKNFFSKDRYELVSKVLDGKSFEFVFLDEV
jgi:hypothetical protein